MDLRKGKLMLVLSRKKNEVICIGDDVYVTVVEVRGDNVRLGIDAPDHVVIDRREVRDAKLRDARQRGEVLPLDSDSIPSHQLEFPAVAAS